MLREGAGGRTIHQPNISDLAGRDSPSVRKARDIRARKASFLYGVAHEHVLFLVDEKVACPMLNASHTLKEAMTMWSLRPWLRRRRTGNELEEQPAHILDCLSRLRETAGGKQAVLSTARVER
jgi:hypothetical protein